MSIIVPVLCLTLAGCGGSSPAAPALLQIQLSPPAPTLGVGTYVSIRAQTTPNLPEFASSMSWSIQGESQNDCLQIITPPALPNMANCPNGVLGYENTPASYIIGVDYYAPNQPGTYQINVQGQIMSSDSPPVIAYQGSATATVTVTAQ
jgi:hypothetical protein